MGRKRKVQFGAPENVSGVTGIGLDGDLVEGFVRTFLFERFDSPKETPRFHKELWGLCCDKNPYVAVAAPRG